MTVTVIVSGIPRHISSTSLAREFNIIIDTTEAEIGTFKVRELNELWSRGKRQIALEFENGFDAMNVQQLLDGRSCNLSGGLFCFLKAKIQPTEHSPQRDSMEIVSSSNSSHHCRDLRSDLLRDAETKLKYLKTQEAVIDAERKLLKKKKKLKKEIKELDKYEKPDSENETYDKAKRRKKHSESPTREIRDYRSKRSSEYYREPSRGLKFYRSEHRQQPKYQSDTYKNQHRSISYGKSKHRSEERKIIPYKKYRPRSPVGRSLRSPEYTPPPPRLESRSREFRFKSTSRPGAGTRRREYYRPRSPSPPRRTRAAYKLRSTSPTESRSPRAAEDHFKRKFRFDRQRKYSDSSSEDSTKLITSSSSVKKDAESVGSLSNFDKSSVRDKRREWAIARKQVLLETKSLVKDQIYESNLPHAFKQSLYKLMKDQAETRFKEMSALWVEASADDLVSHYRAQHSEVDDIEVVKKYVSDCKQKVEVGSTNDDSEVAGAEPVSSQQPSKVDSIWNVVDEALLDIQIDEFNVDSTQDDDVSNDNDASAQRKDAHTDQSEEDDTVSSQYPSKLSNDNDVRAQSKDAYTDPSEEDDTVSSQYPSKFAVVVHSPAVPENPQFSSPTRTLMRDMKTFIDEATKTSKHISHVIRRQIQQRLMEIMKGKDYTRTCLIVKAYREIYDSSGDKEFVSKVVNDINEGKYDLYIMEAKNIESNVSGSVTEKNGTD